MTVTVYTKPQCVQCDATKRDLGKRKIPYETVDVTKDEAALQKIKDMGYKQAPVVVTDKDHWSGFRPDKLKSLDPNSRGVQLDVGSTAPRIRHSL